MEQDDLEPIDLEPVDLQPGEVEPGGDGPDGDRARRGPRSGVWIALVGAGLAAWAAIALTTHGSGRGSQPAPAPTVSTISPAERIAALESRLFVALEAVGSGRFAMVVDDHLYLVDARPAHTDWKLVPLPAGDVRIEDESGPSLLASTFGHILVSTQPVETRVLSAHDTAIRAVAPRQWWFLRDDGTIRDDQGKVVPRAPDGIRLVAAVGAGFIGLAQPDFRWVLWTGSTVRNLAPPGYQLLVAGPRSVVFKSHCAYGGCQLEIVDVARGTVVSNGLASIPEFAAFSPDGSRLALATTQGDVLVLDPTTGATIAGLPDIATQSASFPFTWASDSQKLLVVGTHDIAIVRASDALLTGDIGGTQDVQQLVALP